MPSVMRDIQVYSSVSHSRVPAPPTVSERHDAGDTKKFQGEPLYRRGLSGISISVRLLVLVARILDGLRATSGVSSETCCSG